MDRPAGQGAIPGADMAADATADWIRRPAVAFACAAARVRRMVRVADRHVFEQAAQAAPRIAA
ncbi:hypothetical protein CIW48_13200 [Methylobacterium sp. P1-11]|nr:hypothetical protein CIW48_13200 [Methylobacterium sp. P1-11]